MDVELVGPLGRGPENVVRMASGGAELALTSVHYYLRAHAQTAGGAAARFLAVVHDRSPLAAFVPAASPLRRPQDLAGRRVAASTASWFDLEYQAGLRRLGVAPAVHVAPAASGRRPSLAHGEVDAVGSWAEAIAVIRHRAGVDVRSIPFGPPVYATGLIAVDTLPADLARRAADGFRLALQQQRDHPHLGLDELCRRHPGVDAAAASEEWRVLCDLLHPDQPGHMDQARWEATVEHVCATHSLPPVDVTRLCRPELLARPVGAAANR